MRESLTFVIVKESADSVMWIEAWDSSEISLVEVRGGLRRRLRDSRVGSVREDEWYRRYVIACVGEARGGAVLRGALVLIVASSRLGLRLLES